MKNKSNWWQQLSSCYLKGYAAQQAGGPVADNPYRTGTGNFQQQRRAYWARGWDRASKGLPLDDSNG